MTPTYCDESSLNTLEHGSAIEIYDEATMTPTVEPDTIPRAYFLSGQTWSMIRVGMRKRSPMKTSTTCKHSEIPLSRLGEYRL